MMDEIREITAQAEYNKKKLRPILDSKTRWYSTLLMIERALEILPALDYVLSRHDTPISLVDAAALKEISFVLKPFKQSILYLCKREASLVHADKVFLLLINSLRSSTCTVAGMLLERLIEEISQRRTLLSTVLQLLIDPDYDFKLENELGQKKPSDREIFALLAELLDANDGSSSPVTEEVEEDEEDSVSSMWN